VLARRRAFPIACYLAQALHELGRPVRLLDGVGGMQDDAAPGMAAGDVLLVAGFGGAAEVVAAAAACRERGARVIAITDGALSPLVPVADVCFVLGDGDGSAGRSLVAPLCLAHALVTSTAHQPAAATALQPAGRKRGPPR